MSLPTDQRTKPPLCTTGTVGAGKTAIIKGLLRLYGLPSREIDLNDERKASADFWPVLNMGGVMIADNADTSNKWLADALASASTGGTVEKRQLYTDNKTIQLSARGWVAVTSANPFFASDAGLADRLLIVRLERVDRETSDAALYDELDRARDAGLSYICYAISKALADDGATPTGLNRRHPDFASFAVKLGRATGREKESINALQQAEADKSSFNLENDAVGSVIQQLMDAEKSFYGTSAELLEKLKQYDEYFSFKWTPRKLGKRISKIWPHLQARFLAENQHNRDKVLEYSFKCGVCGVSEGDFAKVPYVNIETKKFCKKGGLNPANPANDRLNFSESEESGEWELVI